MQELLLKRKHLFFLNFFTNNCESLTTHMVIFCRSQAQISAKKNNRDSLRKFHRTYGLLLENYLSDQANHYRKCPTVRRPLGKTGRNYFMINLHESMGPGWDRSRDPWICSQTRICCQTCYRLRYAARFRTKVIQTSILKGLFSEP